MPSSAWKSHGMQFEEFNRMAADITHGHMQFDVTDLGIIYNALDEHDNRAIQHRVVRRQRQDVYKRQHWNFPYEPKKAVRRKMKATYRSDLSLIHISEPTRLRRISYAVFCLEIAWDAVRGV
eukprot:Selendium_serpulae@DN1304_c1_g1_i1.p2